MLEEGRKLKLMQIHREVDSLGCGSCVSVSKYSSKVENKIDKLFIKQKTVIKVRKPKKSLVCKCKSWLRKQDYAYKKPQRQIISVILAMMFILTMIPHILPAVYGNFESDLDVSIEPDGVYLNDTVFINVSIPRSHNITFMQADMAGVEVIDLALVDNTSFMHIWTGSWFVHNITPDEHIITILAMDAFNVSYSAGVRFTVLQLEDVIDNETVEPDQNQTIPPFTDEDNQTILPVVDDNETVAFVGLNLSMYSDKTIYAFNETVTIKGEVSFNHSLVDASVDLVITGSVNVSNVSINSTAGVFSYQFIPTNAGKYIVQANVSYLNDTAFNETGFDVLDIVVDDDSCLNVWDDTDSKKKYVNEIVRFYADCSLINASVENITCMISFYVDSWSEPSLMNYTDDAFVYLRSFDTPGEFFFKVTCNSSVDENVTAVDGFVISSKKIGSFKPVSQVEIGKSVLWRQSFDVGEQLVLNLTGFAYDISVDDLSEDDVVVLEDDVVKTLSDYNEFKSKQLDAKTASKLLKKIRQNPDNTKLKDDLLKAYNKLKDDGLVEDVSNDTLDEIEEFVTSFDEFVDVQLVFANVSDTVEISYYTEAPEVSETVFNEFTKEVVVSSDMHYTDVLTYSYIKESPEERIKLYHIVNGSKIIVEDVNLVDTNGNGLVDMVMWVTPSLSNQTYLIVITKAEHLDENRSFVSDIYDEVYRKDDIWSEPINDSEYVRVTFERALHAGNDITIFARSDGLSEIEVYTLDNDTLITTFEEVTGEEWYKIYLSDMIGSHSVFDLRIVGDFVEFDYIVDPYIMVSSEYTFEAGATAYIATAPINETDFLIAYMDDADGDKGNVVVGRVASDNSISYGDIVTFCADVTLGLGLDICIVNSATNRFMIAYADDGNGANGYIYTSTFSELVIDTGSDENFEFEGTDMEHPTICKIRDDYAVVCYNDEANGDTGQAMVVYWDSGMAAGAAVELDSGGSGNDIDPFYTASAQLDTDKFVVGLVDTEGTSFDGGTTFVGTVSDTTITMGQGVNHMVDTSDYPVDIASFETDKFVFVDAGATVSEVTSATVSTRTITEDASANCGGSYETDRAISGDLLDSNTFIVAYADENNADKGTFVIVNISWSGDTVTWGSAPTIFNDGVTTGSVSELGISVCRLTDTSWVVAFQDTSASDAGKCVLGYTNLPPTQSNPGPSDGATGQELNPTLNITVDDPVDKTLTATWRSNSSNSWVDFATNSSIVTSGGAVNIIQVPVNFTTYNKKYWWSVNVTDGKYWSNETYSFTTKADPGPTVYAPITYNSSTGVQQSSFVRGDVVWVKTNVTYEGGRSDINTSLVNITDPSSVVKVDNVTLTETSEITVGGDEGYMYHYNYTLLSDAAGGSWTVTVWSNDTLDTWNSNNVDFTVVVYGTLNITWNTGSEIDCDCTEGDPCSVDRNQTFWMNVTVKADGAPGDVYGSVDVSARANWSGGATMYYINTTSSEPFFVNGSGGVNTEGILTGTWYNMSPTISSGSLTPRYANSGVFDSNAECVILFGGDDGDDLSELWAYNFNNNTWFFRDDGGGPSARQSFDCIAYDLQADKTIIFGGHEGSTEFNDTWAYDFSTNTWENRSALGSYGEIGGTLTKRTQMSMSYDSIADRIIMYGGNDDVSGSYLDETWIYNYTYNKWCKMNPNVVGGPMPVQGIQAPYSTFDEAHNCTIMFGGIADFGASTAKVNYTYVYYYDNNTWVNKTSSMTVIGGNLVGRFAHIMSYDSNAECVIMFGGSDVSNLELNDTWVYNLTDNTWCKVDYNTNNGILYGRFTPARGYDSVNRKTIIFGGYNNENPPDWPNSYVNETWVYNYTGADSGGSPDNPESLGTLSYGDTHYVNFSINASGTGTWIVDVNVTSDNSNVADNSTCDAYITISEGGEDTSISITPDTWNIGTINLGDNTATTDVHFNLTNDGEVAVDVQVKASDAINSSTGLTWALKSTPSYNNYTLQYDTVGDESWVNINSTYDTITQFVENLDAEVKQGFDLKIFMAATSSGVDPLTVTVTFKSVAS